MQEVVSVLYSTQATSDANKGRRKLEYNRAVFSPGDSGGGNFCSRLCFLSQKYLRYFCEVYRNNLCLRHGRLFLQGKPCSARPSAATALSLAAVGSPYGYNRLADIAFLFFHAYCFLKATHTNGEVRTVLT